MRKILNILVIGVGGNVSQGILKALELSQIKCRVIGACISPLSLGLYTVDKSYICPKANDDTFILWLINICKIEQIDAIFSGVEEVLEVLSYNKEEIYKLTGAKSIVQNPQQIKLAKDKLLTCEWLKMNNCNYPKFAASEDKELINKLINECNYPFIAKPRNGKGSNGIIVIKDRDDLNYASNLKNYVIQEYLGNPHLEFTAGCFCNRNGEIKGTIVMKRELYQGTTYRAELGDFPEIRDEVIKIAKIYKPMGTCNFQLRLSENKPVCFEINARFSGTTPVRARFGFNEVEATLKNYILNEEINELPYVNSGIMLRYWNEIYIDNSAYNELLQNNMLDNPKGYRIMFEDFGERK